jgi:hypothetical protein
MARKLFGSPDHVGWNNIEVVILDAMFMDHTLMSVYMFHNILRFKEVFPQISWKLMQRRFNI